MLTNDAGNAVRPMLRYPTQCAHAATCQELTFAGPDALDPCVIKLADITAVLEPSTARSTTTEFAGFLECAAFGALVHIFQGCSCCGGWFCGRTCGRCKVTQDTTNTYNNAVTTQYTFK